MSKVTENDADNIRVIFQALHIRIMYVDIVFDAISPLKGCVHGDGGWPMEAKSGGRGRIRASRTEGA